MSENGYHWVLILEIVIIIVILVALVIMMYSLHSKISSTLTSITKTSTDVDTLVNNADPVFKYAGDYICKNITPKPTFCK